MWGVPYLASIVVSIQQAIPAAVLFGKIPSSTHLVKVSTATTIYALPSGSGGRFVIVSRLHT